MVVDGGTFNKWREKILFVMKILSPQVEISMSAVRYPGDEIMFVCLPSEMIILLPVVSKFRGKI